MDTTQIRYLEKTEKKRSIALWKEAFPEDTEVFLEYYYSEKTRNNQILVMEEEEKGAARIVSMLHRNPYRLWIQGRQTDSDYIVAVATAEDRRHRGYMRRLLTRMMEDMHQEGMPFCFLMPADRKIYEPFGFTYIYDQEYWQLTQEAERKLIRQRAGFGEAEAAAAWMNRWLKQNYQVFAVRDKAYAERLLLELKSEQGWMEFLYDSETAAQDGSRLSGIRCFWGTGRTEQRMLLCRPEYRTEQKKAVPAIMARITDLKKCLEMICLREDSRAERMEVILHIEDSMCLWNQGMFLWKLDRHGSEVVRWEEEDRPAGSCRLDMGIAQLTRWIFGYPDREAAYEADQSARVWQQDIGLWSGVFLDEVV